MDSQPETPMRRSLACRRLVRSMYMSLRTDTQTDEHLRGQPRLMMLVFYLPDICLYKYVRYNLAIAGHELSVRTLNWPRQLRRPRNEPPEISKNLRNVIENES